MPLSPKERRDYLAGEVALKIAARNPLFAAEMETLLNHYVTDPEDRALFDCLKDRHPDKRLQP